MSPARAFGLALLLLGGTARADAPREVFSISPAADGAVIALSALVTFVPAAFEDRLFRLRCPCDRSEVPGFERFAIERRSAAAARASDVTLWLSLAAPPLLDLAVLRPGRAWVQDATVFAEAIAVSSALATVVKLAVQRPIPLAYAGDPAALRDRGSYRGFYSGHTTLVFTALTDAAWTIRLRHGELVWPWVVAGVAGTSVAVERVLAGRHFPSDVVAGGAVGIAVGTFVPLVHRRAPGAPPRLALRPSRSGFVLSGTF